MIRRPPSSPLFPYTPLFRSRRGRHPPRRPPQSRRACPPVQAPAARPSSSLSLRRSEEHTSELQSRLHLVCRLLLEKKKNDKTRHIHSLSSPVTAQYVCTHRS